MDFGGSSIPFVAAQQRQEHFAQKDRLQEAHPSSYIGGAYNSDHHVGRDGSDKDPWQQGKDPWQEGRSQGSWQRGYDQGPAKGPAPSAKGGGKNGGKAYVPNFVSIPKDSIVFGRIKAPGVHLPPAHEDDCQFIFCAISGTCDLPTSSNLRKSCHAG